MRLNRKIKKTGDSLRLKWKLFLWLAGLSVFVLATLWLSQIVFLDDFYYYITRNGLKNAGNQYNAVDTDEYDALSMEISLKYSVCVLVYNGKGDIIASVNEQPNGIIHRLGADTLNNLYNKALANGGSAFVDFYLDISDRITVPEKPVPSASQTTVESQSEESTDIPETSDGAQLPYEDGGFRKKDPAIDLDRLVYVHITKDTRGEEVIVMLDCAMTPVGAITNTLTVQLVVISAFLLAASLAAAFFMSRRFSRPIAGLSKSAKELAKGRYDMRFSGGGCREIDELSESLEYAKTELSKLDRMQKELIANISHDLRTPLTMISGYSEIMRDIPGEATAENLQVIIDETQRLTLLVNDLLELSRLNSGKITVKPERFSVTGVLRETVQRFKVLGGDSCDIIVSEDGEAYVYADRLRITQAIYNLIGNAVNYTGVDGKVYIRQSRFDGKVKIDIIDTGEGMTAEELPHVWERYYRGKGPHKRPNGGAGIGLSIVKGVFELHGAAYGVSSEPGKGSDFWFELPESRSE